MVMSAIGSTVATKLEVYVQSSLSNNVKTGRCREILRLGAKIVPLPSNRDDDRLRIFGCSG